MKRKKSKVLSKLPKPALPKRLRRISKEEKAAEAISSIPRITNETVAEHREEVLSTARKYIYPLQHSKHRIVVISTILLATAVVTFFVYSVLALYKFQSNSAFLYRVTQVIPFPVAKAGPAYVAYENYLFELRRYVHYYQTQQKVDFADTYGKQQLASFRPQALQQVIDAAYVKQLASKNHVSVTEREVNDQLGLLRSQNQLGASDQELADVTSEFFGWTVNDLKRELKQELLAQKVAYTLDTATQQRAKTAALQLQNGADFAKLAGQVSDDAATKANGGQYANTALGSTSSDVPPQVLDTLLKMKVGEVSGVIYAGNTLEIVKVLAVNDGKVQAAHISFQLQSISKYLAPYEKQHPYRAYISVK